MNGNNSVQHDGQALRTKRRHPLLPGNAGDWVALLVCVVASFLIWCYVMSVDSPMYEETFNSVPIQVSQNAEGMTAITGDGTIVEVTLRGRKTAFADLSDEKIEAYLDLSDITAAGKQSVPVVIEAPSGTAVTDYSPREMMVYVDKNGSKQVDVETEVRYDSMSTELQIGTCKPSVTSLVVQGPQTELDRIALARLVLQTGTITTSFSGTGDFVLVDHDGNEIISSFLKMSAQHANCEVSVCTAKTVTLTVDFQYGYLSASNTEVSIEPKAVTLWGPVEKLKSITELNVSTIDETTGNLTQARSLSPSVLQLPEGVELSQAPEKIQVSLSLKNSYTTSLVLSEENITLKNAPEGVSPAVQSLQITVRGSSQARLADLKNTDLTAVVDMSNVDSPVNGQKVNAVVTLRGGDSAAAFVTGGPYQVTIQVN